MPRATVTSQVFDYDLKALEGGQVTLRKMSYGEKLERRAMVSKALMKGGGKGSSRGSFEAEMNLVNAESMIFSFQRSIVGHNLEDEDGRQLNLSSRVDIEKLDPRVGEEIDTLIDKLNNFSDEDDEGPNS